MYEIERIVSHSVTGGNDRLKLSAAADMMMDCCQFQEFSETELRNFLTRNHMAVFLASLQLDIVRMPEFQEKLKVKVAVYDCRSIYGFRRITIRDARGELCVIANGIGAFFNFREERAVKLPDEVVRSITIDPPDEMEELPRKISIPSGEFETLEPYQVMRSRLDRNRHLTSSEYLALAAERLPENFSYNRVRVEYKLQARCGDLIVPRLYRQEDGSLLANMVNSSGKTHAAVEFSHKDFSGQLAKLSPR